MTGGFPPIGLPDGVTLSDIPKVLGIAFSCFVLIVAQSAATSRSFAAKHGQRVDVNRDLVGLSGASLAAGLSGTFVVNGSPTKTQILDEQKGRTQIANITMSAVVLVVVLSSPGCSPTCPRRSWPRSSSSSASAWSTSKDCGGSRPARLSEFVIAAITAVVVFAVGVEQGIVLAIVLSILEIIRRAYSPATSWSPWTARAPRPSRRPSRETSLPGLLVFRFDAELSTPTRTGSSTT